MASLFEIHEFEDAAIAALHRPAGAGSGAAGFIDANVLCATDVADVLKDASELLRQAGYAVFTAGNAADAATLLVLLASPRLVVTTRVFREASDETFTRLLATAQVMDLAPDFLGRMSKRARRSSAPRATPSAPGAGQSSHQSAS